MKAICQLHRMTNCPLSKQEIFERSHRRHHRIVSFIRLLILILFYPFGNSAPKWAILIPSFSAAPARLPYALPE